MNDLRSIKELLESIIEDLSDTIYDYGDSMTRSKSRIDQYEYRIRREELLRVRAGFRELLEELED